jgi:hypothetical protein
MGAVGCVGRQVLATPHRNSETRAEELSTVQNSLISCISDRLPSYEEPTTNRPRKFMNKIPLLLTAISMTALIAHAGTPDSDIIDNTGTVVGPSSRLSWNFSNKQTEMKKRALLILTAALGLTISAFAGSRGGSTYNPYRGLYGGWDFDNGGHAEWSPYYGLNGGWEVDDGNGHRGRYQWNPYKGLNGGWDYSGN